jgi:hypothetical protein
MLVLAAVILLGVNGCEKEGAELNVQGITMSFVENAPPATVNIGQEFSIYVDIVNKGGSYINTGEAKFYLGGIGYDLKNVEKSLTNSNFLSKESTFPERLTFAKNAKWITELENPFPLYLILTSCYNYGTVAQVDICVSSTNVTSICSISGEKVTASSNSAAPIQVTSVAENLEGNKLKLTILVENKGVAAVGASHIYLPNTDCDKLHSGDFNELQKENKVKVIVRTGAEPGWTCKLVSKDAPFSAISGLDGAIPLEPVGKIVCEKMIKEETHVMPLTVSLQYRYVDSITKSIRIMP